MVPKQKIQNTIQKLARTPIYFRVFLGVLVLFVILCSMAYLARKTVQFSYSSKETCTKQILFLPDTHRVTGPDTDFEVRHGDFLKISNIKLFSFKTCFRPTKQPQPGNKIMSVAPRGGWLVGKTFRIQIPSPPTADLQSIEKTISTINPLKIKLSDTDGLNDYQVAANNNTAKCVKLDAAVGCDIRSLNLNQDQEYTIKITRSFNSSKSAVVASKVIHTLKATTIVSSSVSDQQVIYDIPTSFTFEFDKPINKLTASITKDSNKSTVMTTTRLDKNKATILLDKPLDRESNFTLNFKEFVATDGSTLAGSREINFTVSGGPSVSNINIGAQGVDANAKVVVTFDQSISPNQDAIRFTSFSGGDATVSRTDNKIILQLHSLPNCGEFSIKISKGLISQYGIESKSSWVYTSRINCRRATEVIGYSVQGRPIFAYFYGSGATTILFTGGIHGNERSGSYVMKDWVSHLDGNAYKIPPNKQIVVVTDLNPDGLANLSRYNANNVNLDRNFPSSNWRKDIDTAGGLVLGGGGESALSEPEAKALADLTIRLQPRLEVSFHAQGSLVGANQIKDSTSIGNLYASKVRYRSMIGQAEETMGYAITGEYEDWIGERYGIPAILIELPTLSGRYFTSHQSVLWDMVNI